MSTSAPARSAITFDAVRRHPPRALTFSAALGALLLAGATFFSNAHLRPHLEGEKFSIDFEDLLRLAAFGACGLYGLAQLPRTIPFFSRSAGLWGLAFCIWTMVTIPMAASPTYALASCASLWCTFLFAPAVLLELGGRRVVLTIFGTLIFYMAASWLAYFAWPELGRSEFFLSPRDVKYRVGGLGGAQQLGLMAAWLIGISLLLHTEGGARWRTVAAPIGLAVLTLPFTESRTSMLAAMAISLLFVWRRFSRMAVILGGCAAAVAGSLALLMFQSGLLKLDAAGLDSSLEKVSRSGNIEEIYNLTGRTEVWGFVLGEIADSPLIGYGYGCERYVLARYPGSSSDNFQPRHAHNLWLNVAVGTGLIGALLYSGMILQQLAGFFRWPSALPDMALILVLVAGNTEPVLFGPLPKTHTVLWMIALFWRRMATTIAPESVSGREAAAL